MTAGGYLVAAHLWRLSRNSGKESAFLPELPLWVVVVLLCVCVCEVTLVGLTLGCKGKRLVRGIKRGKLDLRSADWCCWLRWHVSETGCIVVVGGLARRSVAVLGTRIRRQRNRGGNSERDAGRKWKHGVPG